MSNHITPEPTTATCTYCKRTDVPLRQAAHVDRLACDPCAAIVERAMEIRQEQAEPKPSPAPKPELPPTVEARAHDVSVSAYVAFKAQWESEMAAHENERQAIHEGTAKPAAWLAEDPCPSWCAGGLDHDAATHPTDRNHFGPSTIIPLVTMEPVVRCYPEQWAQPELMVSLDRRYREREARVYLSKDDSNGVYATLAEAERLAHELLALVAEARGEWRPAVLPFDPEGRCNEPSCTACRPGAMEASA
ncbi:DUF6907 domain-containing protein [Nonomuraea basaltis]|uniref:DUF6907 domain-containing protein n=1 Tax=Nonomuraea basaltis TaxID=2495887 RepID=UPI00110C4367|nr:hypothetical protein [Nonomuraea basaltis]TMR95601.1 hypothetical protein EJK15_27995 [Nonomuraea basaltis]